MAELSTYGKERFMRTAWTAVIREESAPQTRAIAPEPEEVAAAAEAGAGAMPRKNPTVTVAAAARTGVDGAALASIACTAIVKGRTRPRAI